MNILERLMELKDEKYAKFQEKLIPNFNKKLLGVRVPDVRKLAKEYAGTKEAEVFMQKLPHAYYDEDMLHGLLISEIKDYSDCIDKLDQFLPYVDNWAVCDVMSPKIFKKNKEKLIVKIKEWIASNNTYTVRFGLEMLMTYFLDIDFKKEYLELPCKIHSDEYYVNMMVSWFFATALAKRWEDTIIYLENHKLDKWVHNKTIQKAIESYRITNEQKDYLRGLKR